MKRHRFRLFLAWVLLAAVLLSGMGGRTAAWAKKSASDLDEEIDELEGKRQDTLDEIQSLKADIDSVEQRIQSLKEASSNLQAYIDQLDRQVNSLSSQISEMEKKIEEKNQEIEAKKEELAQAEARVDEQYEMMKKRICYMYENGGQSFLDLLLESGSIVDMLSRAEYAMNISAYDRQMMENLKQARDMIAEYEAALETEQEEQKELLATLQSQKEAVNRAVSAKTQEIASYQAQIGTASGDQEEYERQLAEQEKLLNQVEQQIAAAAAAKAAAEDGDGGASGFVWPCPASHRITSYFGPRSAPVPGASTDHKGIDIGAAGGSHIVAAAAGRVTTSAYSGSAGNYVVISHGNGVSTVYMHASALYVSEGEKVEQGQKIAAVGSTGFSTGPHLHFGVIVYGNYVNPLNYVR